MNALYDDKRYSDARWLASQSFDVANMTPKFITSDVDAIISSVADLGSENISGNYARAGFAGNYAQAGFAGNYAQAGFAGDGARIDVTGANAVIASAGGDTVVKLGPGGAAALCWHDSNRIRFVTIYEGEDGILPDVFYTVRNGKVEVVE